ncbi:hypothetical protein BJV78DRAFT_1150936 [Lactifluus subvellereus]|nr:hypothetical protein BJV78DRAFT_1150936 [Lactifluus subvellereus]
MWGEKPDPVRERLVGARDTFALLWDKTATVFFRTRKQGFSLPFDSAPIDASVIAPSLAAQATLRKSFRRTLSAVSAFRVRMRTVFVPYILLGAPDNDPGLDDALAAGHAEHTALC